MVKVNEANPSATESERVVGEAPDLVAGQDARPSGKSPFCDASVNPPLGNQEKRILARLKQEAAHFYTAFWWDYNDIEDWHQSVWMLLRRGLIYPSGVAGGAVWLFAPEPAHSKSVVLDSTPTSDAANAAQSTTLQEVSGALAPRSSEIKECPDHIYLHDSRGAAIGYTRDSSSAPVVAPADSVAGEDAKNSGEPKPNPLVALVALPKDMELILRAAIDASLVQLLDPKLREMVLEASIIGFKEGYRRGAETYVRGLEDAANRVEMFISPMPGSEDEPPTSTLKAAVSEIRALIPTGEDEEKKSG